MQGIGEKIRIQRAIKGYSQEYMAYMLDISQAAYSNLERDETEMTITRIFEIAEIFEISAYELMPKPKFGLGINYHQIIHAYRKFRNRWLPGTKTISMNPPAL